MKRSPQKSFFWSVITAICLLILLSATTSCQAYKKKICMTCPTNTVIKDSIHEVEVIVHDSVYKTVQGPTVTIQSPCDSVGNLKPFKRVEKKNGLVSTVENINGYIVAKCDADSLLQVNATLTKTIERFRSEVKEVPKCDLEHVSKMDSFFIILGRVFSGIILLLLIYLILKFYFKFKIP